MPKVRTDFWAKPIPLRQFDWSATYDGYDEGDPVGYGRTEQEAIDELLDTSPPPCVDCAGKGGIVPGIECATCEGSGERCENDPLDPIIKIQRATCP